MRNEVTSKSDLLPTMLPDTKDQTTYIRDKKESVELKFIESNGNTNDSYENTDEVFKKLGEFGYRTKLVLFFLALFMLLFAWNDLAYLFYGLDSPWYCTHEVHRINNSRNSTCNYTATVPLTDDRFNQRCHMKRTEWTFEKTKQYSMVTEYDLICDKSDEAELMLYFAPCGRFLGFIPAILCDVVGRKPILFISAIMLVTLNVIGYFTRDLIAILVILLLTVTFNIGIIASAYLLATEIIGPKTRAFTSNFIWVIFPCSLSLMTVVAYFIPYWRTMRLVLSLPALLLLLTWRYIPESPRWLHVTGNLDKSAQMLSRLVNSEKNCNIKLRKFVVEKTSLKYLFLNRDLLKKHIYFGVINFFIALLFFGINISATFLSGNFHLDFALLSLVEIPASLITIYVCDRFGRKLSTIIPLWISFSLLAGISGVPMSYALIRSILGIAAKFFITISFNAEYLLVCESYATCVRSQALCIIDFGLIIGNACAPWLVLGLKSVESYLPFALMTVFAGVTALLCHFMVETKGKPTIEVL